MKALMIVLIIAAVIAVFLLAVGRIMVEKFLARDKSQNVDRETNPPESVSDPDYKRYYDDAIRGQRILYAQNPEDVSITSFDGLTLRGWYLPAKEPTNKYMVCVHGYRCYGPYEFGGHIEFLMSLGCNLLFPDDRACGRSDGKYMGFGNLDSLDCIKWCNYLIERFGEDIEISLHGVSMGAATILAAAGSPDAPKQIKGVCADCGFSSGLDEVHAQVREQFHLPAFPFVPVANWELKRIVGFDLKERGAKDMIPNFKGRLLIIHGGNDTFVPTAMAQVIYDAAQCEKDLLIVPGAAHALAYLFDPKAYEEHFLKWYNSL